MSLLPETLFDEAKAHLRRIEAQHGVRILYASEAGSRSWGLRHRTPTWTCVLFTYALLNTICA